jgi:transposase InsO family protein
LYEFINEQLTEYSIAEKCSALGVTKQGFYQWKKTLDKPYKYAALLAMIKAILDEDPENKGNYGANRVLLRLKQDEYKYTGSYSTVYRVMKANNLLQKKKRNPNSLTVEDRAAQKSENLINQNFTAEEPNSKWLTDISEVPTADGKLYISPILDCFDGQIVGLAMADHMRKELCIKAFKQACMRYNAYEMIFHSDRGSQFTSQKFREELQAHGAIQSMSGTGRCYDNARMESFIATLKKEKLYKIKTELLPMDTVKSIIFRWIFQYYNRKRVYTANEGGYPPEIKRKMYEAQNEARQAGQIMMAA